MKKRFLVVLCAAMAHITVLAKMPTARNKSHSVLSLMLFSPMVWQYDCTFAAYGTIRQQRI